MTGYEPATYACVGTNDNIAFYRIMEMYIKQLKEYGINAKIDVFPGLKHGFGIGQGTIAEGWINHAVQFWEDNIKN